MNRVGEREGGRAQLSRFRAGVWPRGARRASPDRASGAGQGPEELDALARTVDRLRTLLRGGLAPGSAWRLAVRDAGARRCDPEAVEAAVRAEDDAALARALSPWFSGSDATALAALTDLCAVWRVAREAGGGFAVSLDYLASAIRDRARELRQVHEAAIGPIATLRLMTALPVIGLGFGEALGFGSVRVLLTTGGGLAALVAGGVLLLLGRVWARGIIRTAQRTDPDSGIALELVGIALAGGSPPGLARRRVAAAMSDLAVVTGERSESAVASVLALAQEAGVPAAALLHGEAELIRERRRSAARERQARAELRLLLPLALFGLPAFFCLGVIPLLLALVESVVSGAA